MARSKRSKKRSAPKRAKRRAPRVVTKFRTRTRTIFKRSRSRGGGGGSGLIFSSRGSMLETVKANAVPAAIAAASVTAGAAVAGMLARRLAPRLGNSPVKVGGAVAVLGILLATMSRKVGAGSGLARAAQFAGLGIVTDGLMRATASWRGKLALPSGSPAQSASSSSPSSTMRALPGVQSQPSTAALLARMAG